MKHVTHEPLTEVRADVWLWAARMYKTRSLAKQAIEGGKVDVNSVGCKPSKALHVGDRVRLTRGEERLELEILALAEQRGPASMAQTLYRETEASRLAREQAREQRRLSGAGLNRPPTRPNKQQRRELRRLKDFP
jgi:ribosome-associated heat shock protein Hsp15